MNPSLGIITLFSSFIRSGRTTYVVREIFLLVDQNSLRTDLLIFIGKVATTVLMNVKYLVLNIKTNPFVRWICPGKIFLEKTPRMKSELVKSILRIIKTVVSINKLKKSMTWHSLVSLTRVKRQKNDPLFDKGKGTECLYVNLTGIRNDPSRHDRRTSLEDITEKKDSVLYFF